jgi:hypothetical protein
VSFPVKKLSFLDTSSGPLELHDFMTAFACWHQKLTAGHLHRQRDISAPEPCESWIPH